MMETIATTRMSSKGQVVIPETIRKRLNLEEGAQFVVVGDADVIILKAISQPDLGEFEALIQQARQQAKTAGLKRKDIKSAVAKARRYA
jgi:AbrB family looped-hinge helix DNA binding protein